MTDVPPGRTGGGDAAARRARRPTLGVVAEAASSTAHRTGSWRVERPVQVELTAPCAPACPAGEQPREWLAQAQNRDGQHAAFDRIAAVNPLPAVVGRVCYHPCEAACLRARLDQAVGVCAVERALGELALERGWALPPAAPPTGAHVLVVGSGPAGLAAAHRLHQAGHRVTVAEALGVTGGMMRYAISAARLPRELLDGEVDRLAASGVELQLRRVVRDPVSELAGHDAVVHCTGVASALALVPGAVLWSQPAHVVAAPQERTVTSALGQGRLAAQAVVERLAGTGTAVAAAPAPAIGYAALNTWYFADAPSAVAGGLATARVSTVPSLAPRLDADQLGYEARRCLSCGSCVECDNCYGMCPDDAIAKLGPGLGYRIDLDYCKGCGICAAECPCGALTMVPELR